MAFSPRSPLLPRLPGIASHPAGRRGVWAGLAVLLVCVVAGQDARAADGVERGDRADEVTVHASQAGGFTSRARLDDAPREVTDAASLVEPLPGVHVRRLGADDSFATLSIRGSSSSQVAIYLAGVPLTGGSDPSLDLATLPLWPGARARVYRSFAPAAMGPASLGGTLAIDPPRARAPLGTEVWTAAGSFGARRLRVGDVRALDEKGDARLATALSASRADDDFTYFDPLASAPDRDVFTTRDNSGHAAVNGLVSLALPVHWGQARDGALTITTLAQARKQHIPGTIKAPTPFQSLDSNRLLFAIELSGPAARGAWSVRTWGRRENLRLTDDTRHLSTTLGPTHTNDAIVASGASIGWRGHLDDAWAIEARGDASGERYAPGSWVGMATPPGAARALAGAALDVDFRASDAWSWSASGRADAWSDSSDDAAIATRADARPTGHIGTELRAGAITLSAHGGAVARPPSFVERFGDRGAFLGDPSLRPESAWTVDAGARVTAGRTVRVRAEIVGFATWADDLIVFVAEGAYGRARATNIGRARLLGGELEAGASGGGLDLRVAYTALATANEAACTAPLGLTTTAPACDRPALPGRPTHDLVADLSYSFGPARVRYGVDAVSGIVADLTGNVVVPPRLLQSAGARLDVPGVRGLRLALDVRNLLDVRTASYDGVLGPVREPIGDAYQYPLPGRSVLLSLRWSTEAPAPTSTSPTSATGRTSL